MTRILGVIGSPRRKGNTHLLVSTILQSAQAAGAIVDLIFLNDLTIKECDGCHACWTGKPCSKHDDMKDVYAKIIESDVIVFGTPVYWYGPTALMKAFIDRLVYFNCPKNRDKIRGKSAVIVVPFEEHDPATADLVVAFFRKSFAYLQMKLAGQIIVPGVTKRGEVRQKPDRLEEACRLGRSLAS
jgi:multimeric flavodoxin WrbA